MPFMQTLKNIRPLVIDTGKQLLMDLANPVPEAIMYDFGLRFLF